MDQSHRVSRPRSSFGRYFLYALIGVAGLVLISSLLERLFPGGIGQPREKIAIVEVTGMILDSAETVRQLAGYRQDDAVLGIILRIDSPGGGVAPSQEIHDEILRVRKAGKKIYASMGSLAASGGYYIAAPTERIYANPGSLTGSIGVIMAFSNAEDLIHKIGLKPEVVKSGRYKDTGSPVRTMTPEERTYLQRVVDDVHVQFIDAVARGRGMDPKEARKLADGRIFTGRQALDLKLVDALGGLEEVIEQITHDLGLPERPQVVQETPKPGLMEWLLSGKSITREIQGALWPARTPHLQFLWLPQ